MSRGVTLVELVVVLAIMGVVGGLVGLAIRDLRSTELDEVSQRVTAARDSAIRLGTTRTAMLDSSVALTLLPDGTAFQVSLGSGSTQWSVDPWTAEVRRAVH